MNLDQIRKLIALMERHGVAEFEQEEAGHRLRIRFKSDNAAPVMTAAAPMTVMTAMPGSLAPGALGPQAAPAPPAAAVEKAPAAPSEGGVVFKSPMVGTVYRSPSPEAEPFVRKGDRIGPETTLCIIEAMKVMNEIKAEMDAEVVQVLVENGQAVEFGQPLFVLKPV